MTNRNLLEDIFMSRKKGTQSKIFNHVQNLKTYQKIGVAIDVKENSERSKRIQEIL